MSLCNLLKRPQRFNLADQLDSLRELELSLRCWNRGRLALRPGTSVAELLADVDAETGERRIDLIGRGALLDEHLHLATERADHAVAHKPVADPDEHRLLVQPWRQRHHRGEYTRCHTVQRAQDNKGEHVG